MAAKQGNVDPPVARNPEALAKPIPTWILAACVPAVAYACAYAYWCGYAWVFGVPTGLISVQPSDALTAFVAILLAIFYFNTLIALSRLVAPILPWWVKEPYKGMLPLMILASLVAIASQSSIVWGLLGFVLIAFVPLIYLMPLIHQRSVKGYANKLRADTRRVRSNMEDGELFGPDLFTVLERIHPSAMPLLSLVALSIVVALAGGAGAAHSRRDFLVTSAAPARILVAVMTDRAFLRAGFEVGGALEVRPANDLPAMDATRPAPAQLARLRSHNELWPE